jgi:aspartate-semialdehyde dehydrogenase
VRENATVARTLKTYHIAVVGATGAVGTELMRVLERRGFPVARLRAIGSPRSAGKTVLFCEQKVPVEQLTDESFEGVDIAFFSAGSEISRAFVPKARDASAVVIDNSPAFRMAPEVPLVIPEINAQDARNHSGIIANPNCTAAVSLMAIYPLHRAFGVQRVIGASYQAVSGTGARAITELTEQIQATAQSRPLQSQVYPHQIAFNVLPHIGSSLPNGYTTEEEKFESEGRKIMHLPEFRASMTCVRVPVYRAHSVAISAEFSRPVSLDQAREVLAKAPGLELIDDTPNNSYPMPLRMAGKDNCGVGRLRRDCAFDNGLSFWVCGDQLLKGAALNAVQIAELL